MLISICQKGSVISLQQIALQIKTNPFYFVDIVFDQKFTINAKSYLSGHAASQLLQFLQPLLIQVWEQS